MISKLLIILSRSSTLDAPKTCVHRRQRFKSCIRWYTSKLDAQTKFLNYPLMEMVTEDNQTHVLEDVVTPLARTPYEAQLIFKNSNAVAFLKQLRSHGVASYPVDVFPIAPSPVVNHYRNKDEFNIRLGLDGDEKTLGFFTGRPTFGEIYAVRPTYLINVKEEHKTVAKVFEDFVKKSPLPPCYLLNDGGYWRRILLRSNLKGDIMAVVTANVTDRCSEEIEEEKKQLAQHFLDNGINLTSLYHQLSKFVKCTQENSVTSLIHGAPCLYETFFGNEYRISPDSFFQINVKAAEVMCEEIRKLAKFETNTTLIDLCCGVGSFSISFQRDVRNCIGIEFNRSSLDDALENCKLNKVFNCEFTLGKVEERLVSVLQMLDNNSNLVVIANPGRSGLHPRVIDILRNHEPVSKIVYVSCDPENRNTRNNFIGLLRKRNKKLRSKPFILKCLKPVDMFPHTNHYEMILLFER